ncbi:MAG: EcsC family protein, partial [Bradymonadaceae bacterium]
ATEIGERLVFRLGRGALAQSLPLVGAAVGGGLDQKFLQNVCETAHHCYRERWLLREHAESSPD